MALLLVDPEKCEAYGKFIDTFSLCCLLQGAALSYTHNYSLLFN